MTKEDYCNKELKKIEGKVKMAVQLPETKPEPKITIDGIDILDLSKKAIMLFSDNPDEIFEFVGKARKKGIEDEISEINKYLERLRGYGCGYHKQLENQMLNRIKKLIKENGKAKNIR